MKKNIYLIALLLFVSVSNSFAGNPDRQGEAGAYELLMNPWAQSAGLHTMTTGMISGVEAMRLNPAGLAKLDGTEVILGHSLYLQGTDIRMNAIGVGINIGKSGGSIGLTMMSLDFGEIPITTENQPAGNGATFTPRFFNFGLTYAHIFENKVSVGVTIRAVSEAIEDVRASTVTLDAGVQYVTGEQDNFKFGISLRNVGGRMNFEGDGLLNQGFFPNGAEDIPRGINERAREFQIQSVLNIGGSYDFYTGKDHRITVLGNYTSNSFSEDQIGGGFEYGFKDLFMVRGGYRYDFAFGSSEEPFYAGPCGGLTFNVPVSKKEGAPRIAIDYGYRHTDPYNGTHNFGLRLNLGSRNKAMATN